MVEVMGEEMEGEAEVENHLKYPTIKYQIFKRPNRNIFACLNLSNILAKLFIIRSFTFVHSSEMEAHSARP